MNVFLQRLFSLCFISMYNVMNKLLEYTYFHILNNVTSYTFDAYFKNNRKPSVYPLSWMKSWLEEFDRQYSGFIRRRTESPMHSKNIQYWISKQPTSNLLFSLLEGELLVQDHVCSWKKSVKKQKKSVTVFTV